MLSVSPADRTSGWFANKGVRQRSVEADLVVLHQMLSWATTVRTSNGGSWLGRNPLGGVRREREKNPQRAVASWETSRWSCRLRNGIPNGTPVLEAKRPN